MIIEASQEHFNSAFELWSETPSEFSQRFGFAQIAETLCYSRARFTLQSEIPHVLPPKFPFESAKIRCKILIIARDFKTSGLYNFSANSYKTYERSVTESSSGSYESGDTL